MNREETEVQIKMPTGLVEKIDEIARLKYLNRADVIIDACAYYLQFHDMNSEKFPETMRNVLFNLAQHDDEFRKTLRDVLHDGPAADANQHE